MAFVEGRSTRATIAPAALVEAGMLYAARTSVGVIAEGSGVVQSVLQVPVAVQEPPPDSGTGMGSPCFRMRFEKQRRAPWPRSGHTSTRVRPKRSVWTKGRRPGPNEIGASARAVPSEKRTRGANTKTAHEALIAMTASFRLDEPAIREWEGTIEY